MSTTTEQTNTHTSDPLMDVATVREHLAQLEFAHRLIVALMGDLPYAFRDDTARQNIRLALTAIRAPLYEAEGIIRSLTNAADAATARDA